MRNSTLVAPLVVFGLLLHGPVAGQSARKPKLKPEEIVTRHLAAAGLTGKEAAARTSLRAVGSGGSRYLTGGSGGPYAGEATLLTQGRNFFLQIPYQDPQYRGEMVAYDGREVRGTNTMLGRFTHQFQRILEEGLFGGVYSMNWALVNLAERGAKLSSKGIAKKTGVECYQLEYLFKRGSDLDVSLFFDAETFRHVMTQYKVVISTGFGLNSSGSTERYTLEEQFDGFETIDGITMPRLWAIRVSSSTSTLLVETKLDQVNYNVEINPAVFSLK